MSKYQGFCIAEFGTNGTGKSYWMNEIMTEYPEDKDVLLIMDDDSEDMFDYLTQITPDEIPYFRGKAVVFIEDDPKSKDIVFNHIYDSLGKRNGVFNGALICVDDAMTVLDARVRDSAKKIFKKRRQRRFDIILNCHGASEYPLSLFKNTTDFLIYQTTDSYEAIASRMNRETAKVFVECINLVNEKAKTDPYFKIRFNLKDPPTL